MTFAKSPWGQKARHKYGAKKTTVDGQTFPSQLEANVYHLLKFMQSAGEIQNLQRHGSVRLTEAGITYKPDFQAFHPIHKETVYFEAKGMETERWRMIKKLWRVYGPGRLFVYKASGRSVYLDEEIIPKRVA